MGNADRLNESELEYLAKTFEWDGQDRADVAGMLKYLDKQVAALSAQVGLGPDMNPAAILPRLTRLALDLNGTIARVAATESNVKAAHSRLDAHNNVITGHSDRLDDHAKTVNHAKQQAGLDRLAAVERKVADLTGRLEANAESIDRSLADLGNRVHDLEYAEEKDAEEEEACGAGCDCGGALDDLVSQVVGQIVSAVGVLIHERILSQMGANHE